MHLKASIELRTKRKWWWWWWWW